MKKGHVTARDALRAAKRIVLKIGSSLLAGVEGGELRDGWLASLADDIAALREEGKEVAVVSSGAVALGRGKLFGVRKRKLLLEEQQAAASCGQAALIMAYQHHLEKYGIAAAQVLLTIDDSEHRKRYLNATRTLLTLLKAGAVPIINENDTVATSEIKFGDNDRLAARVAQMISADALVLFSDIDGLYTANPRADKSARHIALVESVTPEIEAMASGAASENSRGGMVTKITAAKIALGSGCHTVIASGVEDHPLKRLLGGARCTLFISKETPRSARKRWIAHSLSKTGALVVDNGAADALEKGKSLLPAGVVSIEGEFQRGETVRIMDAGGCELGCGLAAYPASEARRIIGRRTSEIALILGYDGGGALIHRDDMALKER